jgi:hypothetical protein
VIHAFVEHTYIQTSRWVGRVRTLSFEGVAFWVGSRKASSRRRVVVGDTMTDSDNRALGYEIIITTTTQPESDLSNLDQAQSTTS